MILNRRALRLGITVAALSQTLVWADLAGTVSTAEQLLKESRPEAALQVLTPQATNYAGDPQFDYALALALMDTGDAGQAELVFERLLTLSPGFHGARLDYARVLVAQQNYAKAQEQLDTLLGTRPPERAQAQIAQLQNTIDQRTRHLRWSRFLRLSTALGYDSNVNSATVVDDFLGFELDPTSREQDSDFVDLNVTGGVGRELRRGLRLSGRLSYSKRSNSQASFVDSDALTANLSLTRNVGDDYQQLTLTAYQFDIDGQRNSDGITLAGAWLRQIAPQWRTGVDVRLSRIDFSEQLEVKDVDRYQAGLLGVYAVGESGQWLLRAGFGIDEPRLSDSRYERDFLYAGASLSWSFNDRIRGVFNADYQHSQFDQVFFEQLFSARREDDRYRVAATVDWTLRPNWLLSHTLTYTRNDTFVDVFEFDRFQALLRLTYTYR